MKEKVLYVKLPENTKYRRVKVTEDGMIGIVYSEECACACRTKKETMKAKVEIPKPKALVGGSVVYKKDNLPYWYCKIKNGRDEFFHLYMEDLTEEDLLYDSKTGEKRTFDTGSKKKFKKHVLKALANRPEEGFRWIPVYEPSLTPNGELRFVKTEKTLVGLKCHEWTKKLIKYSPENESDMSSKTTYYLLLLRWLKDGVATLEQLVDLEHDRNSKNVKSDSERKFGGLDGFLNSFKIVEDTNSGSGYSLLGYGAGNKYQIANFCYIKQLGNRSDEAIALMELKK